MRELDIYDIKAHDSYKIKYEARKLMNDSLVELENKYNALLVDFSDNDKYLDYCSLFDKIYVIFDFMYIVGMVNRFIYESYLKILEEMDENVKGCRSDEAEEESD